MPHHHPLTITGTTYDLAHLDPVAFSTPSAKLGRSINVWCWFTTHTYTEAASAGYAGPFVMDEGKRQRVFCPTRYALSHHLPGVVRLLGNPDCYVLETASERNWLHQVEITITPAQGQAITYQMFFAVKRATAGAGHDVEMVVESAYARDPQRIPKVKGRTKIAGLLTATVQRRRLHTQRQN